MTHEDQFIIWIRAILSLPAFTAKVNDFVLKCLMKRVINPRCNAALFSYFRLIWSWHIQNNNAIWFFQLTNPLYFSLLLPNAITLYYFIFCLDLESFSFSSHYSGTLLGTLLSINNFNLVKNHVMKWISKELHHWTRLDLNYLVKAI